MRSSLFSYEALGDLKDAVLFLPKINDLAGWIT